MPSETVYFKDRQSRFLDYLVSNRESIDNRSQAVQHCITELMENTNE